MSSKSDLRVLTVIDSLVAGGAETSLAAVTPSLVANDVNMHVAYLLDRPGLHGSLGKAGATLHSLDGGGGRRGSFIRIRRLIDQVSPDLVHTVLFESDNLGRVAAASKRVPVVSSLVGEQYGPEHLNNPKYSKWKVRGAQMVDAATAQLATRFHSVSNNVAELMTTRLRIDRDLIDVIPRGRDRGVLGRRTEGRRQQVRDSLALEPRQPLIVTIGRQYHIKGLDTVIHAFGRVQRVFPDASLMLIGREGPETPHLRRIVDDLELKSSVVFAGQRTDVADLLCAADVFVSGSRSEGSPGVVIEAMAMEAPVVACDIPAVRELAGQSRAIRTVVLDDPEDMSRAVLEVIEDNKLAKGLVDRALERFEHEYTIESVSKETIDFYHRSLTPRIRA